jgi:hypothetical protein
MAGVRYLSWRVKRMGREEFVAYVELFLDITGKAVKYRNGWTSRLPSQISAAMIQQVLDHMVQEGAMDGPVYLDGDTWDGYVIVGKDGEMLTSRGRTPVEAAQDFVIEKLDKWLKTPA